MKVIYINHYAGSDSMGMEFRPYYIARELTRLGHEVLIIAGDYSHLRKHNPTVKQNYDLQTIEGINYLFLQTGSYQGNGVARVKSMMKFVTGIIRGKKQIHDIMQPDAVICSSTYPLDTYAGRSLAKASGARLYHEIHDLWPLSPMELGGYSKYHPFIFIMQRAENAAYLHSRKIISILPNVEPYVRSLGFQTPVIHIPNGLPSSFFDSDQPADPSVIQAIDQLHQNYQHVIAYAGGLSVSNAMMDFVKAFEQLKDQSIAGLVIGAGIEKEQLMQAAQAKQLPITFLDPIPKATIIGSLKLADSLYIGSNHNKLYQYGVAMNKIFDYLMAGRPIVSALDGKHSPLNQVGLAITAEPEDISGIAQAIIQASQLSDEARKEINSQSPAFVKQYHDYHTLGKQFAETIAD